MIPLNLKTIYRRMLIKKHDWRVLSISKVCDGRLDILMGVYKDNSLFSTSLVPVGLPELICFPGDDKPIKDTL